MMEAVLALLFGLLIGSFLNVCIYRWPRDLSVVRPRSHCVACQKMIAWYDNIPLASFVILGGRCRHCRAPISWRYPLVELATGALFFYWVVSHGPTAAATKMCVFSAIMVALLFCDLEQRILPDELTLGGLAIGLILAAFVRTPDVVSEAVLEILGIKLPDRVLWIATAVMSAALPTFFLWGAGWVYEKVRHREGLGFGDVKLVAMVGAFLGLENSLMTLILGSVSGSILGYAYIKLAHKDASTYELPFGTFLCAAALIVAVVSGTGS
jgi:leader peptidase (prepilin peptidase) / N-methyltransferase